MDSAGETSSDTSVSSSDSESGDITIVEVSMICSKRGYLVNKLIVLIPGEICYTPMLQPANNYGKIVKVLLGLY